METSDSEYFESADEDFRSDDEDTKTVRTVTKDDESKKDVESTTAQFKNARITETQIQKNTVGANNNENSDSPKVDNAEKDELNNVNTYRVGTERETVKKLETRVVIKEASVDNPDNSKPAETQETKTKPTVEKTDNVTELDISKEENLWDEIEDWGQEKDEDCEALQKVEDTRPILNKDIVKNTQNVTIKTSGSREKNLWDETEDWDQEKDEENMPLQHTTQNSRPIGNTVQKVPVESTTSEEKNLWDDTDDWGEKDDNMWDNDEWEAVDEPSQLPKPQPEEQVPAANNTSWGSWGNWGVSSILSTATQGVSSLTQGITTVLETGIGVPEPEELARINQTEKQKLRELSSEIEQDKTTSFGLGNLVMGVSHLTKLVETTSTKVISGGLDTLETIGKKTMEVLQEGDPGLKKKRAFLKIDQDKPVLSQLLREAKEKAEEENKILEDKHFAKKAKNYETLFDDHQGLVHLEALEMLSRQCDIKLQTLLESYSGESLIEMQETMDQVKELCELPDEDEDEQTSWADISEKLSSAVCEINIPISYKKLVDTWEETEGWLNNLKLDVCDERELHQQAVETLAQLTALAVEQFHKAGELLLVKEHRSTADEADSLVQLTTSLTSLVGIVAAKFSDKLNAKSCNSKNKEAINGLITNVFFEAANSSSYIQDAFQLLVPVLQVGAV